MPKFNGNKDEYQEWKGKLEDWIWIWRDKKLEGYFGFKLRTALKEEPWILVARLPREQVASKGGIKDMLDILDQKYELVMEQ